MGIIKFYFKSLQAKLANSASSLPFLMSQKREEPDFFGPVAKC